MEKQKQENSEFRQALNNANDAIAEMTVLLHEIREFKNHLKDLEKQLDDEYRQFLKTGMYR